MHRYTVTVWTKVAYEFEVEAKNEQEAEEDAIAIWGRSTRVALDSLVKEEELDEAIVEELREFDFDPAPKHETL